MSNIERTGWRDEGISRHHREWGVACPATDLDFVLVERKYNNPVALIEYKNQHSRPVSLEDGNILCIKQLGDKANLPVFVVKYSDNFYFYGVLPINSISQIMITQSFCIMNEQQYVNWLYQLRGEGLPISMSLYTGSLLQGQAGGS